MRVRAGSGAWRALALLIGVPWVAPEPMWGDLPTVDYDHFGQQGRDAYLAIEAAPGERFVIRIVRTCKGKFQVSYTGITIEEKPSGADVLPGAACTATDSIPVEIVHEARFRGYHIAIESQDGKAVTAVSGATVPAAQGIELPARATLTVEVPSKEPRFLFAGGFAVSELTDRRYALITRSVAGEEKSFVVRDRQAEDDFDLGLAAMVHGRLSSRGESWLGRHAWLSLGLGVNGSSEVAYFPGLSFDLGRQGFVTLGYQFGARTRLPDGVRETDLGALDADLAVKDANVLNDLPTKTDGAVFLAFSYTFLGSPLDSLKKPFAAAKEAPKP
jgi:hypothetical protein